MVRCLKGDLSLRLPAEGSCIQFALNMPLIVDDFSLSPMSKILSARAHLDAWLVSQQILDVVLRYKSAVPKDTVDRSDEGAIKALSNIYNAVKAQKPVRMVLPAFPFKSPNSQSKVLGPVPDKAEEVALAHLNGLCAAIQDIYEPGAKLVVVSDGVVYNGKAEKSTLIGIVILTWVDLLGVQDHVVWNYGKKLRAIAKNKMYNSIEFARLKDLLGFEAGDEELDDMSYAAIASTMRLKLMTRIAPTSCDDATSESSAQDDANKELTYRGYLKFLELDLASTYPIGPDRSKSRFKRGVGRIAKCMLKRGDAFARAVRDRFPDHVRLSIHPSTGEDKISINILPVSQALTPWHNTVAFKIDGTILAGNRSVFEAMDDMELIYEGGEPSYFREKSYLYDWGATQVAIEPMYPSGIVIRPSNGRNSLDIDDLNILRVRGLAEHNSPVVLRGFARSKNRNCFVATAYKLGQPMPWKFGLVLEVKDCGSESRGLNNVLSAEWMPFHFDGMFKTQKRVDELGGEFLVPDPPRFQFFTAVTPSPSDTGYTLFSTSRLIFQYLPQNVPLEKLKGLTWKVSTASFDSSNIKDMQLITSHPSTAQPCLRYHERWPQAKTRFDPTFVEIDTNDKGGENICDVLELLMHDRRVCYWHAWEEGDMLVSDNFSTLHTRSSFTANSQRELWRIHFD